MNVRDHAAQGFALPVVLLLLLSLTLLAHGVLLLSQRDLQASRAFRQATQAREAARSNLAATSSFRDTLEAIRGSSFATELSAGWTEEGIWRRASARWLTSELFLLLGEGGVRGWGGVKRMAGVGWMLDPETRLGAFQGGVEAGGPVKLRGGVGPSADSLLAPPHGWDEADCQEYRPILDSIFGGVLLPSTSELSESETEKGWMTPGLGLLGGTKLLGLGEEPSPSPSFGTGQGCPGTASPVFWRTEGSLILRGDWACGLLVVGGDLVLDESARFQGVALVGGSLEMKGSSEFQGFARIRDATLLLEEARLDVSACAAYRALAELEAIRTPILLPWASNINAY